MNQTVLYTVLPAAAVLLTILYFILRRKRISKDNSSFFSRLPYWAVSNRRWLFFLTLAAGLIFACLMLQVSITSDMSEYLPDDSSMKQGIQILQREWTSLPLDMSSLVSTQLPTWIVVTAVILVVLILVMASSSFTEPFLYLFTIGTAILINLGSNYITQGGSISDITASITALLQLVLSLDYSVMLANRFRQECDAAGRGSMGEISQQEAEKAMGRALERSAGSVLGSGMTTVVGLLTMVFMSFKIGEELGFVLAKGALCSMVCVFTMLPMLLLKSRKIIAKTAKKPFNPPTSFLAGFSFRCRFAILLCFIGIAVSAFIFKSGTRIAYILDTNEEAANVAILVYENKDEDAVAPVLDELNRSEDVNAAIGWGNTFAKWPTLPEFLLHLPKTMQLYEKAEGLKSMFPSGSGEGMPDGVSLFQMSDLIRTENYSLLLIDLSIPRESDESYAFFDRLDEELSGKMTGEYHLIGESVMAWELSKTFSGEMNRMTILTAAAIFLVVFLTFRSFMTPVVLVAMIQTSVYITMVIIRLQGNSIFYLAFLMVQSILMGATIDYAIVYSKYYNEARCSMGIADALKSACRSSINVILTSSLIIIIATFILGFAFPNPTIGTICHTISLGTASALLMVLFLLPGILSALDRGDYSKKPAADEAVKKRL